MIDARKLLDALVGAVAQAGQGQGPAGSLAQAAQQGGQQATNVLQQAVGGLKEVAGRANQATGGLGQQVDQAFGQIAGGPAAADLVRQAKDFVGRNPGLAEAALMGVAGLMMSNRRSRGLTGSLAGLGGLALIGGLAYKAFQNSQAGRPLLDQGGAQTSPTPDSSSAPGSSAPGLAGTGALPAPAAFDPATATEDDAVLYARAMVAAATADGRLDEGERARIAQGLAAAGIDDATTRWLETELADPATVDELSDGITTPEKAAKVYAAARIAIEPDTMQEREFLRQLAESLDLDAALVRQIDDAASGLKTAS